MIPFCISPSKDRDSLYPVLPQDNDQYCHYSDWSTTQQGLELHSVAQGWSLTLTVGRDHKSPI